ncbi:CRISPR-associated helicase/endonuclease Cas3 [Cellulosilyticum sp. I15G10I2]|uniref:CRISPR-associated helicase/endonuclease Cas3 n=1 Tax=Cellulosilyticum sp. I15G10I2 TaxID=1892843 RepID=UPI00085CB72A|nr:CRISPR-associated helicase/endonuclease Cas3 [Cellulosilyticum sp. I15G10I2]
MIIDERFIAKTIPTRKDIQGHTDDLLRNLELIKEIYPNLKVDWDLLRFACIYHDLGKMNARFQAAVHGKGKKTGIPHGLLSLGFIDVDYLEEKEYSEQDIKILFHAVAYHHERDINYSLNEICDEIKTLKDSFEVFEYSKLPTRFFDPKFDKLFFHPGQRLYEDKDDTYFFQYVMLKGLLNRIDHAASAEISVEYKDDFLMKSMKELLKKWKEEKPESKWNDLQQYMLGHQNENVIVIAQTGMGKTEAGLLWLGDNKGFFTLPLKSAINAIYARVKNGIVVEDIENRVGLLHSDTLKVYLEREEELSKEKNKEDEILEYQFENYYTSTKQLSLPLTICTLDQIFDFVYRYRGFESKLATLSYSKIIIDEIQMYAPELVAYLIIGLSYITKLGGKYAILTATLPGVVRDLMTLEGIQPPQIEIFTNEWIRHSLKVIEASIDEDKSISQMVNAFDGKKVLVICNTIKRAKLVYEKLKKALEEYGKSSIYLLHSGFIRTDRSEKENRIMETGKKGSKKHEIWVSTQIVEASLDIDFDCLFTELSDLNGLFQRMGRCYRHRTLDVDYNCFIFTGGSEKCSGIGANSVIEPEIHELSKEALKFNGEISEDRKVKMIDEVYSIKKLKDTSYYTKIETTLRYVKSITEYEYTKRDINTRFRDIKQTAVIPLPVYLEHQADINKNLEILKDTFHISKKERNKAREAIRDLMVPVHSSLAINTIFEKMVGKGIEIIVVDAGYSTEEGISFEKTKNKEYQDVENRMF